MFQLIAILAFFIIGLLFFAIGKDDFGIKRIKEDSNNNSNSDKELDSTEKELSNKPSTSLESASNKDKSASEATSQVSD